MTSPDWQWHRDKRLSAEFQFPDFAIRLLGPSAPAEIEVLDVGSGPASTIGRVWPGHTIHLTKVDPLARPFNDLLVKCGYAEAADIVVGSAETLPDIFAAERFDLVYCGNALDHTHAPLLAIQNMMRLLKTGGWLVLICFENEGETEGYTGLHQWNFCLRDKRLILWNRESSVDVFASIEGCERNRVTAIPSIEGDSRKRLMAAVRKPRA